MATPFSLTLDMDFNSIGDHTAFKDDVIQGNSITEDFCSRADSQADADTILF